MNTPHRTRAGLSLVELALTFSLLVGVGGSTFVASRSLTSAFALKGTLSTLDAQAHEALVAIAGRLEAAAPASFVPLLADPTLGETAVEYARVVGYADGAALSDPSESLRFEASPGDAPDGLDNDGNGVIDDGQVAWIERLGTADETHHVLARGVARDMEGEVPANGLDDNGNGLTDEGGLALVWDGRTLTVHLTLEARIDRARCIARSYQRTLALSNAMP